MTRLAHVFGSERVDDEGAKSLRVKAGDVDTVTASQFGPPGYDAPPLPGDVAVIVEGDGTDDDAVVGYIDPRTAGVAVPGEQRITARNSDGQVVGVLWLRGDGTLELGLDPTDFVARASRTDAEILRLSNELAALTTAFNSHTHLYSPGPSPPAPTATPLPTAAAPGTPETVASETVKVQP